MTATKYSATVRFESLLTDQFEEHVINADSTDGIAKTAQSYTNAISEAAGHKWTWFTKFAIQSS